MLASYSSTILTTSIGYKLPRPALPSTPSTFEEDFGFVLMTSSWSNRNNSGNLGYNARGGQSRQAFSFAVAVVRWALSIIIIQPDLFSETLQWEYRLYLQKLPLRKDIGIRICQTLYLSLKYRF